MPDMPCADDGSVGFVVIGRNEGLRLRRCLESVARETRCIVYVDSGSNDGSPDIARRLGISVIELSDEAPFTAARARNAGAAWMRQHALLLRYIHFIDGDCELQPDWLARALAAMAAEPQLAAVCGRRRERHPDRSAYNRLCDKEWNTHVGIVDTCGGDALLRVEPFWEVGGFSETLIAGEEPDLCHRIRRRGWIIRRIDAEMTVHDAAMTRFAQWWQRNRRSGYATAQAFVLRGKEARGLLRNVVSNIFWAIPLSWPLWPVFWCRIFARRGALEASFLLLGKLPHLQGQMDYWRSRRRLIEYK
ncbi:MULTISPECIES: glycosyltransferase family 2 protein [unclassified Sphingobium]|uniref:glycosyltransferase family 2 protein n=1 Tax=unclassified Sphingobium TaxID=2611147 RepID=UPI000A7C1D6B|nr:MULTISPECIES: glycosyltransferase family 2 protein [unclassified Sphingobium]